MYIAISFILCFALGLMVLISYALYPSKTGTVIRSVWVIMCVLLGTLWAHDFGASRQYSAMIETVERHEFDAGFLEMMRLVSDLDISLDQGSALIEQAQGRHSQIKAALLEELRREQDQLMLLPSFTLSFSAFFIFLLLVQASRRIKGEQPSGKDTQQ